MPVHEVRLPDLLVSDQRERIDVAFVHAYLSERSYWARGIPLETVARSLEHSLCFGAYRGDRQVAFARVITDRATFGWIADVFVLESERGHGVGKHLVEAILAHPDVGRLRRVMLATADAHGLYAQFGFAPQAHPERFMEISRPNPYNLPAGDIAQDSMPPAPSSPPPSP